MEHNDKTDSRHTRTITAETALSRLSALCSTAEHCEGDLRRKMTLWGLDADGQDNVIDKLAQHRFFDDARYAMAFAADKLHFSGWGPVKIDQAMRAKGIDAIHRRQAIEALTEKEYLTALTTALAAKRRTTKADSPWQLRQKLIRFALSRGFTMQQINVAGLEE